MATVKKQDNVKVLKNVPVAFAKIAEPGKKYKSEDLEYVIDCIVDKATAKAWNKEFPKQKAKEFEAAEFEEKFKMASPFGEDDEVFVIKLKKAATKAKDNDIFDGKPNPKSFDDKYRPKVFLDTLEDGVKIRTEITVSRLISNGTIADVSYRTTDNDFGHFAHLQNIRIDEDKFKEYVQSGGAGSEFDDDNAPTETRKEPENESATKARANKAAKAKPEPEPEDDDEDQAPY